MSTVVGNMLMILVTLSLAAILVAWAGTSFGAFSGGSQLFFAQREQALQERFVIEEVFFNDTATGMPTSQAQQIFIFVRNVGPININIVAIYVNGTSASTSSVYSSGTTGVLAVINNGASHGWDSFTPGTTNNPDAGCLAPPSGTSVPYVGLTVGAVCEFALAWPDTISPPTSCAPNYCPWSTNAATIFQIVVASGRGNQEAYTARAT